MSLSVAALGLALAPRCVCCLVMQAMAQSICVSGFSYDAIGAVFLKAHRSGTLRQSARAGYETPMG